MRFSATTADIVRSNGKGSRAESIDAGNLLTVEDVTMDASEFPRCEQGHPMSRAGERETHTCTYCQRIAPKSDWMHPNRNNLWTCRQNMRGTGPADACQDFYLCDDCAICPYTVNTAVELYSESAHSWSKEGTIVGRQITALEITHDDDDGELTSSLIQVASAAIRPKPQPIALIRVSKEYSIPTLEESIEGCQFLVDTKAGGSLCRLTPVAAHILATEKIREAQPRMQHNIAGVKQQNRDREIRQMQQRYICWGGATWVFVEDDRRYIQLSNLRVGDRVMTSSTEYRAVTRIWATDYTDPKRNTEGK